MFTFSPHRRVLAVVCALLAGCGDPCAASGAICTVAGLPGLLGFNGDGLLAHETALYLPSSLVVDGEGRLIVADFNNMRIRRWEHDGRLVTVVGDGFHGFAEAGDALQSSMENPIDIALGPDGKLYIAELHTSRVLAVEIGGRLEIFAGSGQIGLAGDDGPAVEAELREPSGVAVDALGDVYVADSSNHCVRVVGADGQIRRVVGDGVPGAEPGTRGPRLNRPQRVLVDGQHLLIADTQNHLVRAVDLGSGESWVVAGTGVAGGGGDGGPAVEASLSEPYGLEVAQDGALFIAEVGGHRVRRVRADGTIETFAGTGEAGLEGDGGPAVEAQLKGPADVAVGPDGSVYIADMLNGTVRRVAP